MLREVMPCTAAVLVPPGWDRRYTEVFGFTLEEIGAEGAASLETKLRSAGLPMEDLPGPADLLARAWSRWSAPSSGQRLVNGGMLGEKTGPPQSRPGDDGGAVRDAARRASTTARRRPSPGTIQWDFADAEPWHLVVANGDTRVAAGPRWKRRR